MWFFLYGDSILHIRVIELMKHMWLCGDDNDASRLSAMTSFISFQ